MRELGALRYEPADTRIRATLGDHTTIDSTRAMLVWEPERVVRAYKGEASYWALASGEDIAWFYPQPLRETAEVADRIAFFDERVDIVVDGTPLERPETPWSRR